MDCEKSGRPMDAYYAPVVAFVREHLIGNEHGTVHEALVTTGARMTLGDGLGVVVEPRETLGELRIASVGPPFYAPGHKWAETGYCLHVTHSGGITTIVVERAWSWIE